jgi:hypothetical protein
MVRLLRRGVCREAPVRSAYTTRDDRNPASQSQTDFHALQSAIPRANKSFAEQIVSSSEIESKTEKTASAVTPGNIFACGYSSCGYFLWLWLFLVVMLMDRELGIFAHPPRVF